MVRGLGIVVFFDKTRNMKAVKRVIDYEGDRYLVAGDSSGTAVYEPIEKKNVIGKVLFSYRPLKRVR